MAFSTLTPLPTAPQRTDDPDTFADRADVFVAALEDLPTEVNVVLTEIAAAAALIDVAPLYADAGLVSIAGLSVSANEMLYATGADTFATTSLTAFGRSLLDDADAATARATLGLGSAAVADTSAFDAAGTGAAAAAAVASDLTAHEADNEAHGISTAMAGVVNQSTVALAIAALTGLGNISFTFAANSFTITGDDPSGNTIKIKGGTGSLGSGGSGTLSFGTTFATAPVCLVSGGTGTTSKQGDVHSVGVASTTGISIANSNTDEAVTYNWIAIGEG